MRRLRASAEHHQARTPTANARNHIRAAASLLAWLRSRWRLPPARPAARHPAPPRPAGATISQDQRWAHAARLLHDTTLDPTDRVAGCLLLLYGQPLSRIAVMTTSQITRSGQETLIQLGRHHVPVPGPLAAAITQLINDGRSHRGVGSPQQTAWLFPGHLPGRPITPDTLGGRLRALGIYAQPGRRAALLDLAAQLPAAVLADLLGLHYNTAARWMHQAGGDWTRYAAELARHPHQP
jgi:hypothetical protein